MPNDPMMLLSFVNTQLRDNYGSAEDLCAAFGVSVEELKQKLEAIDYTYDETLNRFV